MHIHSRHLYWPVRWLVCPITVEQSTHGNSKRKAKLTLCHKYEPRTIRKFSLCEFFLIRIANPIRLKITPSPELHLQASIQLTSQHFPNKRVYNGGLAYAKIKLTIKKQNNTKPIAHWKELCPYVSSHVVN